MHPKSFCITFGGAFHYGTAFLFTSLADWPQNGRHEVIEGN